MEEKIESTVSPEQIWKAWEKAHGLHHKEGLREGQKGKHKFSYEVLKVEDGKSFSILWKTLGTKLIFTHKVEPTKKGSLISYHIEIKGMFAWPVRLLIGNKIKRNMAFALEL